MDIANLDPSVKGFYCHHCAGNNIQTALMNILELFEHGKMFHDTETKDMDDYIYNAYWYDIHKFHASEPVLDQRIANMALFTPANFPHARPGFIGPRVYPTAFDPRHNPNLPFNESLASDGSIYYGLWCAMSGPPHQSGGGSEVAPKYVLRPGGFVKDTQVHHTRQ